MKIKGYQQHKPLDLFPLLPTSSQALVRQASLRTLDLYTFLLSKEKEKQKRKTEVNKDKEEKIFWNGLGDTSKRDNVLEDLRDVFLLEQIRGHKEVRRGYSQMPTSLQI